MNGDDEPKTGLPEVDDMVPIELPSRLNRHQRRAKAARTKREFLVGFRVVVRDRNPQTFRYNLIGGYDVMHPTKGWREFNPRRLARVLVTAKQKGQGYA